MNLDDLDTTIPALDTPQDLAELLAGEDDTKPALKPAWATVDLPKELAFKDKPTKRIFYDFSEVDNAVHLLKSLPGPGETIHAIMDSHFKGIDLVPAVIKLAGQPCRELIVTTLGFNRRDAACLCELKERGDVLSLAMVCSNFFAEKDMGAFNYARERFEQSGSRLSVCRNHSKILLFDFGEFCYVNESSANLRSNNNIENFALSNSRDLFNFHKTWIMRVMK